MQGYSLMTIRQHLLAHYFRNIRQEFDLAIAAFNEMDLGRQGIQYVHAPLFGCTGMRRHDAFCNILRHRSERSTSARAKPLPGILMSA